MSVTLSFGNDSTNDIAISNPGDLSQALNAAATLFKLPQTAVAALSQPVSAYPANTPLALNYKSGNQSWTLGSFTFGLSGGVSGSITVMGPGQQILKYTDAFPTTIGSGLNTSTNSSTDTPINVPDGQYYLAVELDLTLSVSAGGSGQVGAVGIKANGSASGTYAVRFYKNVAGTMLFGDALTAAFQGFVLPLHPATYSHLNAGDYLYHEFDATLNLGFGATLGLDKVYFSGQYKADIPAAPAAPSVNTSVELGVKAGASFNATFRYTAKYEALLWKTDANTGRLHLYRYKNTDTGVTIGGEVTVIANPSVSASAGNLQQLAQQVLPGGTGGEVSSMLSGKAQDQANSWVGDLNRKIGAWLKPLQPGQTQLQVAIDSTTSKYLLMDVTFALQAAGFQAAWAQAIGGDFVAALGVPDGGMSLDPGSGLEGFHKRETSVTFNLFGLFKTEWSDANIDNQSILYKGNNIFNLVEVIGTRETATFNSKGKTVDVYFAAAAQSGPGGLTVSAADLHIDFEATNNSSYGQQLATLLSTLATGGAASQLANALSASAATGNSAQTLSFVFKSSAYGNLQAATLGKNSITNGNYDQSNFNAFANANSQFFGPTSPPNFSVRNPMDLTFAIWSMWNIAANDAYPPPPGDVPSRRDSGNTAIGSPAYNCLNAQFNNPANWQMINYVLSAASQFMNLCDDLHGLIASSAAETWSQFVADLQYIVSHDVPFSFLIPTAGALANLMSGSGDQPALSGPAQPADQKSGMRVTVTYS
ncbi:MAG TPA: hypothetical protein VMD29_02160 [Terracidiphilus sp.]|nr:hypothetical protein [Terracidiphilus sp.]